MKKTIKTFERALLSLDRITARRILAESKSIMAPLDFVELVIAASLENIGNAWQNGTVALSQVYMSGRICEEIVDTLMPPGAQDRKNQPKMAIAVLEDFHLLGKRIVYSVLRAGGYELQDYGRMNVSDLVERVATDRIELLLISVLMLPSALRVKELRELFADRRIHVKIIVGGAPFLFDGSLWQEVGADAMGRSASDALSIISTIAGKTL